MTAMLTDCRTTLLVSALMPPSPPQGPVAVTQSWIEPIARKAGMDRHGLTVLESRWPDAGRIEQGMDLLEDSYEHFARSLTGFFNQIHAMDLPQAFWEMQCNAWLQTFLNTLADRYQKLSLAQKIYGKTGLTLAGTHRSLAHSVNYDQFTNSWCMDEANVLGLYTILAKRMGIPVMEFDSVVNPDFPRYLPGPVHKPCRRPPSHPSIRLAGKRVLAHYLNCPAQLDDVAKELGMSLFVPGVRPPSTPIINRNALPPIPFRNHFEELAAELLPGLLPPVLIEDFQGVFNAAEPFSRYKAYLSSYWLCEDPLFLAAAGLGRMRGASIIGWQHGGAFGHYKRCPTEWIERRTCTHYVTWGWTDNQEGQAETIPLPQMQLSALRDSWRGGEGKALMAGTSIPRHTYRLQLYPAETSFFPLYLNNRMRFLEGLTPNAVKSLRFRPYVWDFGWLETELEMMSSFPEIETECSGDLTEQLRTVPLFICDHIGTAMLYALLINTPTILFWDREFTPERPESVVFFDALRQAGILFHDPSQAAQAVNHAWPDLNAWWQQEHRQAARKSFVQRFCSTGIGSSNKWNAFLDDIIPA